MTDVFADLAPVLDAICWNDAGLVPAIAQDVHSGRVLMMAWMNRESLALSLQERRAVYWSRSRGRLWRKGEESGHVQWLRDIRLDCDGDCLLLSVEQVGGVACHTGRESCFFQQFDGKSWQTVEPVLVALESGVGKRSRRMTQSVDILKALAAELEQRKQAAPESSYVASLYHKGLNKILEKVGEEAVETVIAGKDAGAVAGLPQAAEKLDDVIYETADLWFHTLVMLAHLGAGPEAVLNELARRFGVSGHEEKAARKQG